MRRGVLVGGAVAAVAALALLPHALPRGPMPNDLAGAVQWLSRHPADWTAANTITERALDADHPARFELWRAARAHASRLSSIRPNTRIAYVRSALFHWYELEDADRREALRTLEPMLRDEAVFFSIYKPLWELTNDLPLLRRANPRTVEALTSLQEVAVTNGRFADYRELRAETAAVRLVHLQARAASLSPAEIVRLVPRHITTDDERLVTAVLRELERRPIHDDPGAPEQINAIVDYAIRHRLGPLGGLEAVTRQKGAAGDPQRARLALALGRPDLAAEIETSSAVASRDAWIGYYRDRAAFEAARGDHAVAAIYRVRAGAARTAWNGLCGGDLCTRAWRELEPAQESRYTLAVAAVQRDEVPPYVELYVDDRRVGEGAAEAQFEAAAGAGLHEIDLLLANPLTRNRAPRRATIVRETVVPLPR